LLFCVDISARRDDVLALFDIDGTLTPARQNITPELLQMMKDLRKHVHVGIVGGSDLVKQKEQLGNDVLNWVDYSFSENGLVAYHDGKLIHSRSIKEHLGEDKLKQFINFCLHYIADLDIPKKRGTFIEFRTGMINVCPLGRNSTIEEREEFNLYDKTAKVREKMVKVLDEKFKDFDLKLSIGGQVSFDVFPRGWDKTYCLQHITGFKEIHFFGDKTEPGGNDYEIFVDSRTIGHSVANPQDTLRLCTELWLKK